MNKWVIAIRIFAGVVLIVLALFGADALLSQLVVITDDSIKPFLAWKVKENKIKKGDYVIVDGKGLGKGKLLAKKVLCTEGETVKKIGLSYYCCGEDKECIFMHSAFLKTPKGRKLSPWNPCGGDAVTSECRVKIKKGTYYLGSSILEGYDSRYLGFFKKDEIITKIKPIF